MQSENESLKELVMKMIRDLEVKQQRTEKNVTKLKELIRELEEQESMFDRNNRVKYEGSCPVCYSEDVWVDRNTNVVTCDNCCEEC